MCEFEREDIIRNLKLLLSLEIPEHIEDKRELSDKLEEQISRALKNRNEHLEPIFAEKKDIVSSIGGEESIEIILDDEFEKLIKQAMKRKAEIFHSYNVDRL